MQVFHEINWNFEKKKYKMWIKFFLLRKSVSQEYGIQSKILPLYAEKQSDIHMYNQWSNNK